MPGIIHDELAWCLVDGIAVFLDIARDRYFRLPDECNRKFVEQSGNRPLNRPCPPASLPQSSSWLPPQRQSPAMQVGRFRLDDVARSMWLQRQMERRFETGSFAAIVRDVHALLAAPADLQAVVTPRAARDVRAFECARLLRAAANRCLPRSIALALRLARHGCRAHAVLGVRLAPFSAHCWVQTGGIVVSDEIEAVRLYTPILVL